MNSKSGSTKMGVTGLEQKQVTTENNKTYENRSDHRWPESGTDSEKSSQICSDLQKIIDRWGDLPEHIQQTILSIVRTV